MQMSASKTVYINSVACNNLNLLVFEDVTVGGNSVKEISLCCFRTS